jgi:hypothetical protein
VQIQPCERGFSSGSDFFWKIRRRESAAGAWLKFCCDKGRRSSPLHEIGLLPLSLCRPREKPQMAMQQCLRLPAQTDADLGEGAVENAVVGFARVETAIHGAEEEIGG